MSSLTAVEETRPVGYSVTQAEPAWTSSMHAGPARINVVQPDYVPGLDLGHFENQTTVPSVCRGTYADSAVSPRKEFGTQTRKTLPLLFVGDSDQCQLGVYVHRRSDADSGCPLSDGYGPTWFMIVQPI